jgi:copper(I)-binding protein
MGVLLFSPVALTACSAGQVAQTAEQNRDRVGGMADAGDIAVRQARLAYPDSGEYQPGGDARLLTAITNGGQADDTLVSITGQDFVGAEVTDTTTAAPTTAAATSTASSTGSSTGPAKPSSATTAATTTAATTTAATPAATTGSSDLNIPVPAGSTVYIGGDGPVVTLTGLSRTLAPGQSIDVTMTFEKAGAVPVQVLVGTSTRDLPRGSAFDFTEH